MIEIRGMFVSKCSVVSKKKIDFENNEGCYYEFGITDGVNLAVVTGGKKCPLVDAPLGIKYLVSFNYIDKKLRVVTVEALKQEQQKS